MKVFLSWSGPTSEQVAIAFRDWLPSVIQSIKPYVSSEDMEKGARWSSDVSTELEGAHFGILFVTASNIEAAWLNFEAGALSKAIDKSLVCPFLFNIKKSELKGPLLQFQATANEKEDIRRLVSTINRACGDAALDEGRLDRTFDTWWPSLEEQLKKVESSNEDDSSHKPKKSSGPSINQSMLEEILELTREQQKMLTSPDRLLPASYLKHAIGDSRSAPSLNPMAIRDLQQEYDSILAHFDVESESTFTAAEVVTVVKRLDPVISYLVRNSFRSHRDRSRLRNE